MKRLREWVPHLTIILSLMTLTFFGIDRVNTSMAFMTSELSKWVFAALAFFAVVTAVMLIIYQWRDDARAARRQQRSEERAHEQALSLFTHHGEQPDGVQTEDGKKAGQKEAEPDAQAQPDAAAPQETAADGNEPPAAD